MTAELKIANGNALTIEKQAEIDANIDAIIERHKGNRQEINRLVFESVAAMTAAENSAKELSSKKGLKRFLGGITGSNKRLQDDINSNRAIAQYTSQQTLQRLAEQNLMSFDLITAVNNKLNASVVAIEEEFNQVYRVLVTFFKQSRSDLIQLENRVERLERNVNLLNWQNSIEYQMFNGVEYADLDLYTKIVCLVRDFYDLSKGQWTTSDLLLLKTAMATVGVSPQEPIQYYEFIKVFSERTDLQKYLFQGKQLAVQPNPAYMPLFGGIKKKELLGAEEQYIVNSTAELLNSQNVALSEEAIVDNLTKNYLVDEAELNVYAQANCFDFLLELLFNLQQADYEGLLQDDADWQMNELEKKYKKVEELFKNCMLKEAHPLLLELSEQGYARANALLFWLYMDGYEGCEQNEKLAKEYAYKGYLAKDPICALQHGLFNAESEAQKIEICKEYKPKLQELSHSKSDVFAEYMMAICYLNQTDEDKDYGQALNYMFECCIAGFYRAYYGVALRYYKGEGVEKSMESTSFWLTQAIHKFTSYGGAYQLLGDIYYNKGEAVDYILALINYSLAVKYGRTRPYVRIGYIHEYKQTEKGLNEAVAWYTKAAEHGDADGQYNLALCYLYEKGVAQDKEKAKYWLEKSAAQGYERAKNLLKENF